MKRQHIIVLILTLLSPIALIPVNMAMEFTSCNITQQVAISDPTTQNTISATYIWDESAITNTNAYPQLFTSLVRAGFNRVYLNAHSSVTHNQEQLASFIACANQNQIAVELMAGDPRWILSENHQGALGFVWQVMDYSNRYPEYRPDAIHLDVEPHGLSEWAQEANHTWILQQYLTFLSAVQQELANSPIKFNVDIPFWLNDLPVTVNGVQATALDHVLSIVDGATIMAYRDRVEDILLISQEEIDAGNRWGKAVVIGMETNPCEREYISFYEDSVEALQQVQSALRVNLSASPSFYGTAVHSFDGYQKLSQHRI